MAVWFARQTANINAANVWNSAADGSGSWLTWPPAAGDILMANGFTLTVNADVLLGANGEIRNDNANGATAGGIYNVSTARTITGNVYQGSVGARCIEVSGASANLSFTGNAYGSNTGNAFGIRLNSGALTFTGNAYGGAGSAAYGVYQISGTLVFTGNVYGGPGPGTNTAGLNIIGATSAAITGNMYGGNGANNWGLGTATGTFTVNMTGNVYGGTGIAGAYIGSATNTFNLTGNVIADSASSTGYGVQAPTTSGPITISGYAQATTTTPAVLNSGQAVVTIGETRSASNGRGAVIGAFRYASATAAKSLPIIAGSQRTLSVLDVAALIPDEGAVRKGVIYGDGAYTGTVPLNRKRTSMAGRF